ncbi:MAG TPA: SH3 domain-containing protein, partial [Pyrinomonadaceae bacterium]
QMVATTEARRKPSADLSIEPEDFTAAAPPRPQFEVPAPAELTFADVDAVKRPRIVVPINLEAQRQMELRERQQQLVAEQSSNGRTRAPLDEILPPSRKRRALVAAGLILAFSGMLLATHKYVTSSWNPLADLSRVSEPAVIGREGFTTTDVNLRPVANVSQAPIGLAESGSKVKVLSADNNWYEVLVVEHARPKVDPYSSDRGWINKRYVRFD